MSTVAKITAAPAPCRSGPPATSSPSCTRFLFPEGEQSWPTCCSSTTTRTSSLEQVRQAFPAPSHRVEVAGTGTAGLEHVRTRRPDVILLDLHLPDQSGLEVYGQIRRMGVRTPVIFVTMARTADAAIEAMKQGAYDYLFKPLDLDQLTAGRRRGPGGRPADAGAGRRRRDPSRTPTSTGASWAAPRPCARSTRPSAASPPRTSPC